MYKIAVNPRKNRLYITLKGFLHEEEMKEAFDETIIALTQLTPEFSVITDISEFKPASPEAAGYIRQAQATASQHGAKTIVRVVKKGRITGAIQFRRLQREAGAQYEVIEVDSLEKSESMLDT